MDKLEQLYVEMQAIKAGKRNSAADVARLKQIQTIIDELLAGENAEAKEEMGEGEPGDMMTGKAIEKRTDVTPKEGEHKYGDVAFADAKNKKYPIDTAEHIRSAWNYINQADNAGQYSSEDAQTIQDKIIAAWKKVIDPKGPPSAAKGTGDFEIFDIGGLFQSGAVKAAGDWTLDILGVPFGGPRNGKDDQGQMFTENTNIGKNYFDKLPLIYGHGLTPAGKAEPTPVIVGYATYDHTDKQGHWFKGILDKAQALAQRIWTAAQKGKARASSDSVNHLVRWNKQTGEITNWPLAGISLVDLDSNLRPVNSYAVALPALKALFANAGIAFPNYPDDNSDPQAASGGAQAQSGATGAVSDGQKSANTGVLEMDKEELIALLNQRDADKAAEAAKAVAEQNKIVEAVKAAKTQWEAEAAKGRRLPGGGAPVVAQFADTSKYDNLTAADLGLMIDLQRGLHGAAAAKGLNMPDVSASAVKALALKVARLDKDEHASHETQMYAQGAMKAVIGGELTDDAIKAATDPMYNYTAIGTEWVGTMYSNQLWEKIRADAVVAQKIPTDVIPDGYSSGYWPLESTDPTWYKVAEVSAADGTMKIPAATVTASQATTDRKQITVAKGGARTMYSGELTEDSLVAFAPQLRMQLEKGGAEQMEHVIIDGDTATSTNINDIGGTTYSGAATTFFLMTNGFRKVGIANGRSAAGGLTEDDYLATAQLLGLNGIAADVTKCGFIVDPNTYFKSLRMATVKTQDVWAQSTLANGVLTGLWGFPLMRSYFMHWRQPSRKANTAGKVDLDTAGNNLYGGILAVRWDQWKLAYKRRMTMETTRFANSDTWEIVALTRWGLGYRDAYAAAETYYVGV